MLCGSEELVLEFGQVSRTWLALVSLLGGIKMEADHDFSLFPI